MNNAQTLERETQWLYEQIKNVIAHYFQEDVELKEQERDFSLEGSFYGELIQKYQLSLDEQKILSLALLSHIAPEFLDIFLTKNKLYDSAFTEFGGVVNNQLNGFTPTIQSALFLLSANSRERYIEALRLFDSQEKLFEHKILLRDDEKESSGMSIIHHRLDLTPEALHQILYGKELQYEYNANFPASKLTTNYRWEDLIISPYTHSHLEELDMWLEHSHTLREDWGMAKSLNGGYKALFYGPSGTGKTLTATLLGKKYDKLVYRINLSQLVSKYVGETEKNLEKIFEGAKNRDWILFFDEADALFSKRTSVSDSNDKYANQETAYLLQKIEESQNLVILASNLKDNFDEAFLRRFASIIYFPIPNESERLELWQKSFSPKANIEEIDLETLANQYELSGANIVNVVRSCSLRAIDRGENTIIYEDIINGIRREKYKEGKII